MVDKILSGAYAVRLVTAETGDSPGSGTALANYSPTPSCAFTRPTDHQQRTWGGARNRADRVSEYLSDRQVFELKESARYAYETKRVFQRHWTIHYGLAGIRPKDGARFVGKVLDLASKQARREGGQLSAIWVRECASDKGEHVHILMHLPVAMRLHWRTRRWIEAANGTWKPGVSKVRIIGGQLPKAEYGWDERPRVNAANVLNYLLKAASTEAGERLGLYRADEGGRIVGKRCGWTQNLGAKARYLAATS